MTASDKGESGSISDGYLTSHDDSILADLELEQIESEDEDSQSSPADYQIATYPADYTLEVLYQKWQHGEILVPEFQRRFVWKRPQASKLVESFLVGLPVPAVFLYSERNTQKYLVIDGQQRLKSIFYYFEGYYGPERNERRSLFRLQGISETSQFHNRCFDELREEDQRRLKNAVLRAFIVQQLHPEDDTSMYHIFERLNTGATLLANQEIRNSIYHGSFSDFLEEINGLSRWREILGKEYPDPRKRDVELVLRFLAMRKSGSYRKPMKDYLSKFMHKNRWETRQTLRNSKRIFELTCESVVAHLGCKPFHLRAGLNAPVLDAVMIAFSDHLNELPKDIRERYENLKQDEDFARHTSNGTTDVDVVKGRLRQASAHLFDA